MWAKVSKENFLKKEYFVFDGKDRRNKKLPKESG